MKVLIVDDEKPNRDGLRIILNRHMPEITIIGEASSALEARQFIQANEINVLLLDVHMPNESGLELLESLQEQKFLTIFITAYTEYAIRALKANAIDYILKPIDSEELLKAFQKCKLILEKNAVDDHNNEIYSESLKNARQVISLNQYPAKLTIPFTNGFQIINVPEISHINAEGNYTTIFFKDLSHILTSRSIKEIEEVLDPSIFFRSHKSHMVNLHLIKSYSSLDGQEIILTNGSKIPLSRRKIEEFMTSLSQLSKKI